MEEKDYYRKLESEKLPVKWLAPESEFELGEGEACRCSPCYAFLGFAVCLD